MKFLYAVLLALVSSASLAQSYYTAILDSAVSEEAGKLDFNGNVMVAKNGNIIYQKSFGVSNYYTGEKLDSSSVFELASVSKQFTAMGILLLVDQGKLKLTDSLRMFFPQLQFKNVTIHHLLTHTGGLPEYQTVMMLGKWDKKKIAFNPDVIEFMAERKARLQFKPGEKWMYSNTGYMLLASIIEKVSGESFKDYMEKNIFNPLKMSHSRVYNTRRSTGETIPNYAYGFVHDKSSNKYVLPDSLPAFDFVYWLDGIQGDGIINSTTGDLLRWDRALKNSTLLSTKLQKEMFKPHTVADSVSNLYYGYGVIIAKDSQSSVISHTGGWPGYWTYLSRLVEDDITVAVLSNNNRNAPAIGRKIEKLAGQKRSDQLTK